MGTVVTKGQILSPGVRRTQLNVILLGWVTCTPNKQRLLEATLSQENPMALQLQLLSWREVPTHR